MPELITGLLGLLSLKCWGVLLHSAIPKVSAGISRMGGRATSSMSGPMSGRGPGMIGSFFLSRSSPGG